MTKFAVRADFRSWLPSRQLQVRLQDRLLLPRRRLHQQVLQRHNAGGGVRENHGGRWFFLLGVYEYWSHWFKRSTTLFLYPEKILNFGFEYNRRNIHNFRDKISVNCIVSCRSSSDANTFPKSCLPMLGSRPCVPHTHIPLSCYEYRGT